MVLCNMPPRAGVLSNSMDGAIYTRTGLDYYWRYCKVSLVMVAEGPK